MVSPPESWRLAAKVIGRNVPVSATVSRSVSEAAPVNLPHVYRGPIRGATGGRLAVTGNG
jgi:hypothetical protein